MEHLELKQEIINTVKLFHDRRLSVGTSGNLSARSPQGFLITPTGMEYEDLEPEDIVDLDLSGNIIQGQRKPSSEWHFHQGIYQARPEINAIVHVHSPFATGIACTRQAIPAFHYMVAIAGGDSIPCAEYATFGTDALSNNTIAALQGHMACLLSNHGQIALGKTIREAFRMAEEVEALAQQYWISLQTGQTVLLDQEEMQINLEKFKTYGKQD